jgi:hypothetical protein
MYAHTRTHAHHAHTHPRTCAHAHTHMRYVRSPLPKRRAMCYGSTIHRHNTAKTG